MRFLLDECLSTRLIALLSQAEHDVVHVYDLKLAGRPDDDVLSTAREHRRILVSADTDFGELLAKSGEALPSVILFRQGNRSAEHQAGVLLSNLEAVASDLEAGSLVVFTDDRIRVRKLPI